MPGPHTQTDGVLVKRSFVRSYRRWQCPCPWTASRPRSSAAGSRSAGPAPLGVSITTAGGGASRCPRQHGMPLSATGCPRRPQKSRWSHRGHRSRPPPFPGHTWWHGTSVNLTSLNVPLHVAFSALCQWNAFMWKSTIQQCYQAHGTSLTILNGGLFKSLIIRESVNIRYHFFMIHY